MQFPKMIDAGRTVQAGAASFVATPSALDGETRWKLCDADAPGAISLNLPGLNVNIDRDASIAANLEGMRDEKASTLERAVDAIDVARHAAMRLLGR